MVKKIMANLDGVSLVLVGRKEFESSLSTIVAVVLSIRPISEWTYDMLDVVMENCVKQKTLCNSVDSEIDADRIAADHGFEDERVLHRLYCWKKTIVEEIWQLMEVVNRQKQIPNQSVQFLVVMIVNVARVCFYVCSLTDSRLKRPGKVEGGSAKQVPYGSDL